MKYQIHSMQDAVCIYYRLKLQKEFMDAGESYKVALRHAMNIVNFDLRLGIQH